MFRWISCMLMAGVLVVGGAIPAASADSIQDDSTEFVAKKKGKKKGKKGKKKGKKGKKGAKKAASA